MIRNGILAIILLLFLVIIAGCSGGGSNCNQTYGGLPIPTPTPTPTPTPDPIYRNLKLQIVYPDGSNIEGVVLTVDNPEIFLIPPTIDENGVLHYVVNPNIPDGTSFIIHAEKDGVILEDLHVVLDENRKLLPDGQTYLYEKEIVGYVPITPDALNQKYLVSTWRITGARFCIYCNGLVAIPGNPENTGGTLLANGFYLASAGGVDSPYIGKMDEKGNWTLFAGSPSVDGDGTVADDGIGTESRFRVLYALVLSVDAKTLYATDADGSDNLRIRKIDTATRRVTTIIEGIPYSAYMPLGMELSPDGRYLYIGADSDILRADLSDNTYTTISSDFSSIMDIALSPSGDTLYVMDNYGASVKAIELQTLAVSTLTTSLNGSPEGSASITLSADGNTIYATDGNAISAIDVNTGSVAVFAGDIFQASSGINDGYGTDARLDGPQSVTISSDGKTMFVLSGWRHFVYSINLETTYVTTLLGGKDGYHGFQEGAATTISSSYMSDLVFSPDGKKVYIVNPSSPSQILCFDFASGLLEQFAGKVDTTGNADGTGTDALFSYPWGICITRDGQYLYVTDRNNTNIRRIDTTSKQVTTVVTPVLSNPYDIDVSPDGRYLYVAENTTLKKIDLNSGGAVSSMGTFTNLRGVAVNNDGSKIYVTSSVGVSTVDNATSTVTLLSDGSSSGTAFGGGSSVGYLTLSADGQYLFVTNGQRVVSVKISDGTAKTIAGFPSSSGSINGDGADARFSSPYGLNVNPAGNMIYVADYGNSVIRRIIAVTP